MAGPTCGIFLRSSRNDDWRHVVDELISLVASTREGSDFWVNDTRGIGGGYSGEGRPFLIDFYADAQPDGRDVLLSTWGWIPAGELALAAMCNRPVDHRLLGEMAVWLADRLRGVVDFGGAVPIAPGPGVVRLPYETASGTIAESVVADARAVRDWLSHPRFHMVK